MPQLRCNVTKEQLEQLKVVAQSSFCSVGKTLQDLLKHNLAYKYKLALEELAIREEDAKPCTISVEDYYGKDYCLEHGIENADPAFDEVASDTSDFVEDIKAIMEPTQEPEEDPYAGLTQEEIDDIEFPYSDASMERRLARQELSKAVVEPTKEPEATIEPMPAKVNVLLDDRLSDQEMIRRQEYIDAWALDVKTLNALDWMTKYRPNDSSLVAPINMASVKNTASLFQGTIGVEKTLLKQDTKHKAECLKTWQECEDTYQDDLKAKANFWFRLKNSILLDSDTQRYHDWVKKTLDRAKLTWRQAGNTGIINGVD